MIAIGLCCLAPAARAQDGGPVLGDEGVRARWVAGRCVAGDGEALLAAISDPDPTVRMIAARCWPADDSTEPLSALVSDPDPAVRAAVAGHLGRLGVDDPHVQQLLSDPAPVVIAATLDVLPVGGAQAPVIRLLESPPSDGVLLSAAAWLDRADGAGALSPHLRQVQASALIAQQLPSSELRARYLQLHHRAREVALGLSATGADDTLCQAAAHRQIAARLELVDQAIASSAADEAWVEVGAAVDALPSITTAFYSCRESTALLLTEDGLGLGDRTVTAVAELGAGWHLNFSPLRDDTGPRGGELWLRNSLQVNTYLPGRPVGERDTSESAIAVSARLDRDHLFRNETVSLWSGGGHSRFQVPFGPKDRDNRFEVLGFALRTPGRRSDYPERLLAGHDRFSARTRLGLTLGRLNLGLDLGAERVRYQDPALQSAGADTLDFAINLGGAFVLELGGAYRSHAANGPTRGLGRSVGRSNRDGFLVTSLTGVRFGVPEAEALELVVLGGTSALFQPDFEGSPDPNVVFDVYLAMEEAPPTGPFYALRVGGRRRFGFSPRDFAGQATVTSYVTVEAGAVPLDGIPVRGWAELYYTLVDHRGSMVPDTTLRQNLVGAALGVRWVWEDWLGFEVSDRLDAFKEPNRSFLVTNRFFISFFVPIGQYAFDREEARPW